MKVEQISIFLENKSGRIAEVTDVLAKAGINIIALSLADTSDFGVLRMILDDNEKAKQVLKEYDFTVGRTNVVAVEVEDRPGGLHKILNILQESEINVEYMYAFVKTKYSNAIMIFRFDNTDKALQVLTDNGVNIIDGEQVYKIL